MSFFRTKLKHYLRFHFQNGIPLRRSLNALKKRNHKTKNILRKRIKKEHKIKKPSQFGNKNLGFSKKINTLTEILRNLFLSNFSLIEDILYGDLNDGFNEVFNTPVTSSMTNNPFANNTIFFLPSYSESSRQTKSIILTTSQKKNIPINYPNNVDFDLDAPYRWTTLSYKITPHPTVTYKEYIKLFTEKFKGTKRSEEEKDSENDSSDIEDRSDKDESVSDNYEIKTHYSDSKGLSIEIDTTKNDVYHAKTEKNTIKKKNTQPVKRKIRKENINKKQYTHKYDRPQIDKDKINSLPSKTNSDIFRVTQLILDNE